MYPETKWTKLYEEKTHRSAYFLEQRWDSRQFWYPTGDYVTWLERKLSRSIKVEKTK